MAKFEIKDGVAIIPEGTTEIGQSAFEDCPKLTSVTIPNSVTKIGQEAFCDCPKLTSVTIPNSVTEIGNYAFSYCKGLTSVVISESVKKIGDGAFSCCEGLTSVVIPEGVTEIGDSAFYYCSNLTGIVIPDNVRRIGNCAFSRCFNIVDITIPSNVAEIGASAFEDCKKLSNVKYQAKASVIKEKTFKGCLSLDTISIPEGVTKIAKEAFMNCKKLPSISIPGSLNEIGTGAFKNCAALVDCTLPEGLVRVGKDVFKGCKSLGAESPEATKKQIKTIKGSVVTVVIKGPLLIFEYCSKSHIDEGKSFHDCYYATYSWGNGWDIDSIVVKGANGEKKKKTFNEKMLKLCPTFRELFKEDGPHPLPVKARARVEENATVIYEIKLKDGEEFDMNKLKLPVSIAEIAALKRGIIADYILYDGKEFIANSEIIEYSVEDLYHSAEMEMDIDSFCATNPSLVEQFLLLQQGG